MNVTCLPLVIEPHPDESISSMLRRLSQATGLPVHQLYPRALKRSVADRHLNVLAEVLGVPARQLRTHTLAFRLRSHHGRRLVARDFRRGDGLPCPECGITNLWSGLVWITTCPDCGCLLTSSIDTVSPPEPALSMQDGFLQSLRVPSVMLGDRIRRLTRLLRVYQHLKIDPATTSADKIGSQPAPWGDPAWMAAFAARAWPASRTIQATRDLNTAATLGRLGEVNQVTDDPTAARECLHQRVRTLGITADTVPDFVHHPQRPLEVDAHGEDLGHAIARALRRETIHAYAGHRPVEIEHARRYGAASKSPQIGACVRDLGTTAAGMRILTREAKALAAAGSCDYAHRRAALTPLHTVPARVLAYTSCPRTPRAQHLAAAWIWLELTHGTLRLSPHHSGVRRELRELDRALLPEDRMVLVEYGYEILAAVDHDVTLDSQRHNPSASSRHADAS